MKRRAMDIIMAISWAGTPMREAGFSIFSRPSVSMMGVVVRVSSAAKTTSMNSLSAIARP